MPLEKVVLTNFQKHKHFEAEFSPGITCIVGPSDIGKSSLLRALRWVCLNQPRGDLTTVGERVCSVSVKVDGREVVRQRDDSGNLYSLDGKQFRAFREEVPQEVLGFLKLSDVNYQGQHDSAFWVSLSSSELARRLNELVNLDLIDHVAGRLEARKRILREKERVAEERKAEAEDRVRKTSQVPELDRRLGVLEGLQRFIEGRRRKIKDLSGLLNQYQESEDKIRVFGGVVEVGKGVSGLYEQVVGLSGRIKSIKEILADVRGVNKKVRVKVPDISILGRVIERQSVLSERKSALKGLLESIRRSEVDLDQGKSRETETKRILMEETRGRCPVCGGSLKI